MNTMDFIKQYIDKESLGTPIFTKDIVNYVLRNKPGINRSVIIEYINRFIDNNTQSIRRYRTKGIFYKYAKTAFGETNIDQGKLIEKICLVDGNERIGYETGPSLINSLGLSTQIPNKSYIVTNNTRTTVIKDEGVVLIKPLEKITKENYAYYQFIDVLGNVYNSNIDVDNDEFNRIMLKYINDNNIRCDKAFMLIKNYPNKLSRLFIYDRLADLMKYGNEIALR